MTLEKILSCLWGGLPYAGGWLFVLLTLVQLAPIKVNPWSWLAKSIGKAMGIAAIEKKLDNLQNLLVSRFQQSEMERKEILEDNDGETEGSEDDEEAEEKEEVT